MLIASQSQIEIDKLKAQLNQEFEMKDLGKAKKILGIEISRDRTRGKLCLTQKQYLKKVLQHFGMIENSKPVSTPLAPHLKISAQLSPKNDEEREYMAKVPYANAVGSLMYAMVCTRPDISQAVGVVSRYMHDPGKDHWQAYSGIHLLIVSIQYLLALGYLSAMHSTFNIRFCLRRLGFKWDRCDPSNLSWELAIISTIVVCQTGFLLKIFKKKFPKNYPISRKPHSLLSKKLKRQFASNSLMWKRGISFSKVVKVDELPLNFKTVSI
ncbi:hypothetical protein Pfo_029198 [Paulownia fortunei]|nr:hypothetical protein Pfo_029198 [Paulownia fortunei]